MLEYQTLGRDRDKYLAALAQPHAMKIEVATFDADENHLAHITDNVDVVDGQVDLDTTADITRQLSVSFLDRGKGRTMSPLLKDSLLYQNTYLRVYYEIYVAELEDWVGVPIFHGPMTRSQYDNGVIAVEASSKEVLMMPPIKPNISHKLSTSGNTHHVRGLILELAQQQGERMFRGFAGVDGKLNMKGEVLVKQIAEKGLWPVMKRIAEEHAHRRLFYSGDGYLTLAPRRDHVERYTFRDGSKKEEEGTVVDEPSVDWDLEAFRNRATVVLSNGKDKKDKRTARGSASLHGAGSPAQLGRNGQLLVLEDVFELERKKNITKKDAKKLAQKRLKKFTHGAQAVRFDSLVVPHLEPGDLCGLQTDTTTSSFSLEQFSIPLTAGNAMSVGYNKDVRVKR